MCGRRRTETRRAWRRVLPVWFSAAVVLSGAWGAQAEAQTDPCPPGQPADSCCTPRPNPNEADEEGLDPDCPTGDDGPGGRSHRRGGDAVLEDNDTGSSDGSFRSGRGFRSGSGDGGEAPPGSDGSEPPGEPGEAERIGAGPESGAPEDGTTGGAPATPGPGAVSSPGARAPTGAPSPASTPAGATSKSGAAGASQVAGSIARTGGDIATSLGLALTLMLAGTSLRRATRPLPKTQRRCRPARRPQSAPPRWSYVDHSAAARAIEKF